MTKPRLIEIKGKLYTYKDLAEMTNRTVNSMKNRAKILKKENGDIENIINEAFWSNRVVIGKGSKKKLKPVVPYKDKLVSYHEAAEILQVSYQEVKRRYKHDKFSVFDNEYHRKIKEKGAKYFPRRTQQDNFLYKMML